MGTRGSWAIDFLKQLGNSNPSEKTVNLVAAWTKGENTEAKYNPLATTLDYGTNTKFNNCCGGNGVKNYSSRDEGIKASIMTLRGNHPGYSDIIKGLVSNDPDTALAGMKHNVWGTNFTHVEAMWRSLDLRSEMLLSEDSNPPKIAFGSMGGGGGSWADKPNDTAMGSMGGGGGSWYDKPPRSNEVTEQGVKNTAKIVLGGILAFASAIVTIMAISKTETARQAVDIATSLNPTTAIAKAAV